VTSVVVAGEALVDLVPAAGGTLRPLPGGSPFNVAIGLGRLAVPTRYLGVVGRDGFGQLLHDRLVAAGVGLDAAPRRELPTTLAVVHLDDDGQASYGFYLDGTTAASLEVSELPTLPDGALLHVSFGAIGPTHPTAGATLAALVEREAGDRIVCLDPNVRPAALDAGTLARLEELLPACDVIKTSDEDLALLAPGTDPERLAADWLTRGPALVVLTRGGRGAVALHASGRSEVPGRPVDVVDTVGAGDAFTAGLLHHLASSGLVDRAALEACDETAIVALLDHASMVAAVTCTRAGADPPSLDELPSR
jgi:fructokinase